MASQEVVLKLRARSWKQNGALASNEFFLSLARLIESSEEQLNSSSCDTSEFLVRRLEEYERTLSTLIARFCEAYGQADSQQTCIGQLNHLLSRTTSLRAHFEQRYFANWIEEDKNERQNGVLYLEQSDSQGCPRLALSDTELDNVVRQVREVTPSAGLRIVQGSLRQRGLVVQRMRVLQTLRGVFF